MRFWNKINFVVKRNLPTSIETDKNQLAEYLYGAYRFFWEKASKKAILKEIKDFDTTFLKKIKIFSWEKALKRKSKKEKLSICEAIPSFMIDHLLPVMSLEFLEDNLNVMNGLTEGFNITARINRLLKEDNDINLDLVIKFELEKLNISFIKDTHIEDLIIIPGTMKSDVLQSQVYQKGYLIYQDKASAEVVEVLSPQPKEIICDMCAAPGIKVSYIAQKMKNKGKVIAGEFLHSRIRIMNQLLSHMNVKNVHLLNVDSIVFPLKFQNMFDRILLDAPCTGSGTFLTNPELKWRQNKNFLRQNTILQKKLLQNAIRMLKPEGILVYSTCSLYPEEGEYIIMDFLNQLEPQNLPTWFSPGYLINEYELPGVGRLFPSIHKTQGFFIAKFKKKEK